MTAKLLTNGGNSFCAPIKNIEHNLKVVPSVDKCMYVISSMPSIKSMNEAEDTEIENEYKKFLFSGDSGGTIIFSTDVNSLKLSDKTVQNWILQKYATCKNRFTFKGMLEKIRRKHNVYAWTIGKYLEGVYTGADGKTYNENSISVNVIGVDKKTLFKLAEDMRIEFKQESVLVHDAKNNQIYFVTK